MPEDVRWSIKTSQHAWSYGDLVSAWREADELGFFGAFLFDHFLSLTGDRSAPCMDGWALLPALLKETRTIRGGLLVSANTFRHPAVLSKMAATVDTLSGGRLLMGLGGGWEETEHRQYGLALPSARERVDRLEEACRILRASWSQERVTFEGRYYQLRDAIFEPKPAQRPGPPLILGVAGPRAMRIAAELADEWNWLGQGGLAAFEQAIGRLDEACRAVGRDPASLRRSVQMRGDLSATATKEEARAYLAHGISHLIYVLDTPYHPGQVRQLREQFIPEVQR